MKLNIQLPQLEEIIYILKRLERRMSKATEDIAAIKADLDIIVPDISKVATIIENLVVANADILSAEDMANLDGAKATLDTVVTGLEALANPV